MKQLTKLRPAIATFLMMIAVSTTSTAISFLNQPVANQLQVGMGSFTLYYSLRWPQAPSPPPLSVS